MSILTGAGGVKLNFIFKKTIPSLKFADGLVIGSAICKEISKSIKKGQNPVTNVRNIVYKFRKKIV